MDMGKKNDAGREDPPKVDPSRRRALAVLGLSAAAAYAAPTLLTLKQAAAKDSPDSVDSPDDSPDMSPAGTEDDVSTASPADTSKDVDTDQ